MWIDTSIMVGDQPVGLSVHRLDSDARDRAAASLAWFSHLAMTGDITSETAAWQLFMQKDIFEHVKFTVTGRTDEQLQELSAAWWDDASRQAIVAAVSARLPSPLTGQPRLSRSSRSSPGAHRHGRSRPRHAYNARRAFERLDARASCYRTERLIRSCQLETLSAAHRSPTVWREPS